MTCKQLVLTDLGSKFLYAVEPQGRMDFNHTVQRIYIAPTNTPTTVNVNVTINIFDDTINEANEGFLVIVRVDRAANMDRSYVGIVTILDDDRT